jgi:hypothetical protein
VSETNYHSVVGEAVPILIGGLAPLSRVCLLRNTAAERVLD